MKKNFEYREPEFNVVITNKCDVLTASVAGLNTAATTWDTQESGQGTNVGFGL